MLCKDPPLAPHSCPDRQRRMLMTFYIYLSFYSDEASMSVYNQTKPQETLQLLLALVIDSKKGVTFVASLKNE